MRNNPTFSTLFHSTTRPLFKLPLQPSNRLHTARLSSVIVHRAHSTVLGATFCVVKRVRLICASNVTFTISYLSYLLRQFAEWEAYLYDRKGADLNV